MAERKHIASATAKGTHIAPRKARMVIDQIRGLKVVQALAILESQHRSSNPIVQKVLQSAIANAVEKNKSINPDDLIVTEARVDQGKVIKRLRARAMGRGMQIQKKGSHIRLSVG
ncbi:MAG: 50S ribosomal protein L22 [Candidatus Lambdaproteobacteria bacterium RIFOXYD12_FULL_49_8]|uniref:Large ribosomal subunit protein uL22 n=1 Tax=Candidatus Lambdaproteobacteria bacterium RIFOXYD2_FULL_50_16 TaxID=1817772 RepID=A0A1F6G6G5_9PROT|nr:MAG: 50S ribosomal protein L22 [Candidatus Lambdaproteobacteria bacterium RIFOXYD2_FULL_50_16]OGG96396.1 MAG: 50S ribosomal protein L22 [Candidatus Lambdaproteobacteria bacterium RIFOXYD12_FULL_49_8]